VPTERLGKFIKHKYVRIRLDSEKSKGKGGGYLMLILDKDGMGEGGVEGVQCINHGIYNPLCGFVSVMKDDRDGLHRRLGAAYEELMAVSAFGLSNSI
jgi:hypothetical protein